MYAQCITTYGECTRSPRRTTSHFTEVGENRKGGRVTKRDVDYPMMGKRAHRGDTGRFLPTSGRTGGHEQTGILAPVSRLLPLPSRAIPEGLELSGVIPISSGDAEEEGIVLLE